MTHRNARLGIFLIALGLLGLVTARAHEPNRTASAATIEKRFTVKKVLLRDLHAAVRVDTDDGSVVRVKATGSRLAIDGLRMAVSGSTLEITQPGAKQTTADTIPIERNVVVNHSDGSTIFFGRTPAKGPPAPLRLQITLPRHVPFALDGRIGAATR